MATKEDGASLSDNTRYGPGEKGAGGYGREENGGDVGVSHAAFPEGLGEEDFQNNSRDDLMKQNDQLLTLMK